MRSLPESTVQLELLLPFPKLARNLPPLPARMLNECVEHVLGMLAAGSTAQTIVEYYPFPEPADVQACLVHARRLVGNERVEPSFVASET